MVDTTSAARDQRIAALAYDYAGQAKEVVTACNLCGSTVSTILAHRDRYGYPAQAHVCPRCGLVFLNPRLTAAAYSRFYIDVYRPLVSAFHGRLIDAHTIQDEQREYAAARAAFLQPFMPSGARTLLDIGGSTGVVAAHLARAFGLDVTLIDPAPLEVAEAKRLGIDTVTGLVEAHDFKGRRFDVVVICQTVDHLLDIAGTLRRVRELLTADGRLFIDIVDFRAAYLRGWSVEGAVKIDHPYYLTEPTMRAYLRRAGLEVLRADYAKDHLHIGFACRGAAAEADAMPDPSEVSHLLRETRFVQSAPR